MDEILKEIILAIIGSNALSIIISAIISQAQSKRNNKDGILHGVRQLLYDRIKSLCNQYLEQGFVYSDDLEDLIRMHAIYHDDCNGNGYLDSLMNKVKALPVKFKAS